MTRTGTWVVDLTCLVLILAAGLFVVLLDNLSAAVVAQPDPKWGETPCAFVELKPDGEVTDDALRSFCRERMAHYKVPKKFVFCELPKTSTGKIQKFALRELARSASAIE